MAGSKVALVIMTIVLIVLIILEILGLVLYKRGLDYCKYNQSPYCYAITCEQSDGGTCGTDASRCQDGQLYCSINPLVSVGPCS